MSYILDALRRADAERQQGGVPGLHTPPSPQAAAPMAQRPWLGWAAAAVLLLSLVAALAWWWTRPALALAVAGVAAPVTVPAAAPQPVLQPAPQPVLSPPAAVAPLPIVVSAAPVVAAVPAAPAVPTSTALVPPAPPAPKTVPLQQLESDQRRQLPPLVVGGSVWSDSANSRFVILDGQVTREGDSVAPGLVLERIQPKSVLLRWRDLRVEVTL